jgi:cob(I)alamin adenosyltransferase
MNFIKRSMSQGFKIYTKTGDKGTSALYTGERLSKDAQVFQTLGAIDELNAHLGLAREYMAKDSNGLQQLEEIQARLIDVGSHVATPRDSEQDKKVAHTEFNAAHIKDLESWIDEMDTKLPPLKNFILPSGGLAASQLHVARTVCRRAERNLVPLFQEELIGEPTFVYVNRLSDYLFMLARTCALESGATETIYKKSKVVNENKLE